MGSREAHDSPHLSATVAGTFTMAEDLTVTRLGYGAMQLAGPHVFGPPADCSTAVAVLREVVKLGITSIDTSDFYGPYVINQIIIQHQPRLARAEGTPVLANTVKS